MRNYVVVGATILAFVATYLVEKFIPIIGLFYGYVPAFFTTVGILWYTSAELKSN